MVNAIVAVVMMAIVGADMTESPLQFSLSHNAIKSIYLSAGDDILKIFDGIKLAGLSFSDDVSIVTNSTQLIQNESSQDKIELSY